MTYNLSAEKLLCKCSSLPYVCNLTDVKVLFVDEINSFNWSHFECFNKSKMSRLIFVCGF